MISIFNGRNRSLGELTEGKIFIQMSVEFRHHLNKLKGAKLAVLFCIALHIDAEGKAFPSIKLLAKKTGYSRESVFNALRELEATTIQGHRILLRLKNTNKQGRFANNIYVIFPTEEELRMYEILE